MSGISGSRRSGGRLRGWGGVAGMATACALALTVASLPVVLHGDSPVPGDRGGAPAGDVLHADQASVSADEKCDPTASLNPDKGSDNGAAIARIKKNKKLIVGVDQNSFLWGYRDPASGNIVGFDIDLVHAIAKDILGDPNAVTFKTVPTLQRIPMIQSGAVDMVVRTMTITCLRLKDVAFSTVYFQAGQQLLVPKTSPIKAFDDTLKGKKVCTADGSTGMDELKDESHGATIVPVPNQLDCLVRLQLGEVDAVMTDNALAAGQAAQDPAVHLVGEQLTQEPYGVAMNKKDTDLVRRVNKVLEAYRSGGANSPWMKAFTKWLSADLKRPAAPPAAKYKD